jgi:hypothetical protein
MVKISKRLILPAVLLAGATLAWGQVTKPSLQNVAGPTTSAELRELLIDAVGSGSAVFQHGNVGSGQATRFAINGGFPSQTATFSVGDPTIVFAENHGFQLNSRVIFTTSGSLPPPIVTGQTYYVIAPGLSANTFQFSSTEGGKPVATIKSPAGTHQVSNSVAAINGQLYIGDPALSYQPDIGPGSGGLIVRNDTISGSAYVVLRNMLGTSQLNFANDKDDLDGAILLLGSSGRGVLSGARSFNIAPNCGDFGVWSNLSAGSGKAINLLTIRGHCAGPDEGKVGIGTSMPVEMLDVAGNIRSTSPTSTDVTMTMNSSSPGQKVYSSYQWEGAEKFQLGLNGKGEFYLSDNVSGATPILYSPAARTLSLVAPGGQLDVGNLPQAGVAAFSVCATSTGQLFLKPHANCF